MSSGLFKKFVYVPLSVIVFKVLLSVNSKIISISSPGSATIGVIESPNIGRGVSWSKCQISLDVDIRWVSEFGDVMCTSTRVNFGASQS